MDIRFTVNGKPARVETEADRPLLEVLREDLGLHGTRFGCGQGDCGACSVLIGGKRVFSCQTDVGDAAGKEITTVEGLASGGKLHAVQEAFLAEGAYQCGYCISGMVVAAVALLNEKPKPTEEEIRAGMNGNLCRCCGYAKIVKAVERAARGVGGEERVERVKRVKRVGRGESAGVSAGARRGGFDCGEFDGVWAGGDAAAAAARGGGGGRPVDVAARVHISKDGVITVMTGKVECGQGARAEITQAAAEELAVSPEKIQLIMGDTGLCPDDGGTFGSRTTPATLPAVRMGCATAREMLIAAACAKWSVDDPAQVELRNGMIREPMSRREVTYGELAGDASAKFFAGPLPKGVGLTLVKDWQVMGTTVVRADARDLVTGGHTYPSDVVRDGMAYGAVVRPPSYGAKLKQIDMGAVDEMKGVKGVRDGDFVGVVAETSFAARKAVEALEKTATWTERPGIGFAELYGHLRSTARNVPVNPYADDVAANKGIRAEYHVAYAQHAPMEPRAAVAEWADGKLTVWTGTQNPWGVRGELVKAFGLDPADVRVIVPDFGGGFGGKHSGEAAAEAARLSKAVGKPVKVRWTRDEEFTWAYFRPAGVILAEAAVDSAGLLSSWYFVNINSGPSGLDAPYVVGNKKVQTVGADGPLKPGSYRGLAATANHFARESFIDELAHAAGKDPQAFRLANLKDERLIAVLKRAADKFGWEQERAKTSMNDPAAGLSLPVGIGLACGTEKGSYVATCVEVAVDPTTSKVTVRRVCQAFECGKIVNPAALMSQVQGAVTMGLGPALREEVKFEKGTVTNGTFADYEVPRFADLPALEIELMDRPDLPPAGAGETPIVTIAPAIANAVFDATGVRVREMPIRLPPPTNG